MAHIMLLIGTHPIPPLKMEGELRNRTLFITFWVKSKCNGITSATTNYNYSKPLPIRP